MPKQVAANEELGKALGKKAFKALMRVQRVIVMHDLLTPDIESDLQTLAGLCGAYEGVYDAMGWEHKP